MRKILLLLLYYIFPVLSSWNSAKCATTSNVTFDFGTLTACITSGPESEVFFQLPYALPPTGERRWKPPVSDDWPSRTGYYRDATRHTTTCPEIPYVFSILGSGGTWSGSEDCLLLDIYRPANTTKDAKLPVFFWIHGGGLDWGDSWFGGVYNGKHLANKHGVIVVNIQYRLNVFGYLSLNELFHESEEKTTGNYGIQDQMLALEWVSKYISLFGGDPDNVSVAGQSAGGRSTCLHLSTPNAGKLFHKLFVQSGDCSTLSSLESAVSIGEEFYREWAVLGKCDQDVVDLECLRSIPTKKIMDHGFANFRLGPVLDGSKIGFSEEPLDVFATHPPKIPVIMGLVHSETLSRISPANYACSKNDTHISQTCFEETVQSEYLNDTIGSCLAKGYSDALSSELSPDNFDEAMNLYLRDPMDCVDRAAMKLLSKETDTYYYYMNFTSKWFDFDFLGGGTTYHGAELWFIFGNYEILHSILTNKPVCNFIPTLLEAEIYTKRVQEYWVNIMKTGKPNKLLTFPKWKKFDSNDPEALILDKNPECKSFANERCKIWTTCGAESWPL